MVKNFFPAIAVVLFLSSCSALKSLNFSNNKQTLNAPAETDIQSSKFINDISVTATTTTEKTIVRTEPSQKPKKTVSGPRIDEQTMTYEVKSTVAAPVVKVENKTKTESKSAIESAAAVQFKYSVLLKTEVENLPSKSLLDVVDQWYGVRYRTGGNTKTGVDCSGFTVAVFAAAYGLSLPRVSREQYRISRKISTAELQEGDLVFFNTRGSGVSHVGVYLGNNKFIHASVSRGVMVNDLFESYYAKRFLGAGRIDDKQLVSND
ncbi:MAG TPA: NlpC/P60 family protein [Chitinophagaceae bacterium]|jgi:cell wall-associated NlpC family hydrolase|nr:NlpC/P60 family protein [Chitinophagaceae bacterium]